MTVEQLIEELQKLPTSAKTATVVSVGYDYDDVEVTMAITAVRYEHGEVVLEHDEDA